MIERPMRCLRLLWPCLLMIGCSVPPQGPAVRTPPRAGGDTSVARTPPAARPVSALADSGPTTDAIQVLETIPEPLSAAERVPPPADVTVPTSPDTSEGSVDADTLGADVPIPSPTATLGQRPPPSASSDSAATQVEPPPRVESPPPPPPARPAPSQTRPAPPDTCWRIQIAAPPERAKAEQKRQAAESVLLVPMVVELDAKRYKVRTRGCLDRAGADRLRARALASGFDGAFRFIEKGPKR